MQDKSLSESEILHHLAVAALALDETHHRGLIHRNVSSTHIYFDVPYRPGITLGGHANVSLKEALEIQFEKLFDGEEYYLAPEV